MKSVYLAVNMIFRIVSGFKFEKAGNPLAGILFGIFVTLILFIVPVFGPIMGGIVASTVVRCGIGRGILVGFNTGLLGSLLHAFGTTHVFFLDINESIILQVAIVIYGSFLGMTGGIIGGALNEEEETRLVTKTFEKNPTILEQLRSGGKTGFQSDFSIDSTHLYLQPLSLPPERYCNLKPGLLTKISYFLFAHIVALVPIVAMIITAGIAIPAIVLFESDGSHHCESELHNVALLVASLMADPITPIHNLATDERIASYVSCNTPLTIPDKHANEADMIACGYTQNLSLLIQLASPPNGVPPYEGENEAHPLTEYSHKDTTAHWYCVYEDGTVEGFSWCNPSENLREIKSCEVCNEIDDEGPNYLWWIIIPSLVTVVLLVYYCRGWHFNGESKP